jgi:hypothetical protein
MDNDALQIKRNFTALALFLLVVLVGIDVVLRLWPSAIKPVAAGTIAAVGSVQQFSDGSSYYIYTVFENTGDVYQCWWDEKTWNQKKVTNYKGPTIAKTGE